MTTPICHELQIFVPEDKKDFLAALLADLSIHDYVEGTLDCDIEFEYDYDHLTRDYYREMGAVSPVVIYSEDSDWLEQVKGELMERSQAFSLNLSEENIRIQPLANQDWRESWKESFQPINISNHICITPPWIHTFDFPFEHKITIDPGMAFGTGQHETTRICLRILLGLPLPKKVFDVGTGSGVLAIAAHMLGCRDILGCDIDPDSIRISDENALINHTPGIRFTDTPIANISESGFDLIFANIQFNPLRKIFPEVMKRLSRDGRLIISGILFEEVQDFSEFLGSQDVEILKIERENHWVGILAKKKGA